MALLLSTGGGLPVQQHRPLSTGGLGGFVEVGHLEATRDHTNKRNGRKRPRPLKTSRSHIWTRSTTPSTPCSTSPRTPRALLSPFQWRKDDRKNVCISPGRLQESTFTLSCDERPNNVATRVKATDSPGHAFFELPGSLLIPIKGFPPPPETPANLLRRKTNESNSSSTPPLTDCNTVSSAASSTMGFWKAKPTDEGSQPSSDGWCHADAHSDKTYPPLSSITKPLNSMSIEELLDALPSCSPEAITEIWVPAMRKKVKSLCRIQSTQEHLLDSYANLKTMDKVRDPNSS